MKVILDDIVNKELIEFLLSQEGILEVKLNEVDLYIEVDVKHNEKITPSVIIKYIELFQNNKFSSMVAFDKEIKINLKKIKYTLKDVCCEYCYKGFVREMFDKKEIISLKSDFDIYSSKLNVDLEIEYDENYKESDLIKYIEDIK